MAQPVQHGPLVADRRTRGFTLIEMMIVVVIVGVLAMLAVVGYRKLVLASHVSEATGMVQNIRVAQEAYHSETQQYADISASPSAWYPSSQPTGNTYTAWGAACASQCVVGADWSQLPLHVDGPVLFGYVTKAGGAGTNANPAQVSVNGNTITFPAPSPVDWYVVAATCDLDGLGTPNTTVYGTSWQNTLWVDAEGQ